MKFHRCDDCSKWGHTLVAVSYQKRAKWHFVKRLCHPCLAELHEIANEDEITDIVLGAVVPFDKTKCMWCQTDTDEELVKKYRSTYSKNNRSVWQKNGICHMSCNDAAQDGAA